MTRVVLRDALLLDPEAGLPVRGALLLEGERIRARLRADEALPEDARCIDLGGRGLAPGFLDLHDHASLAFTAPADYAEALGRSAASLLRHGTTGFLPTTLAWPAPDLLKRVKLLASCAAAGPAAPCAEILGIHLEGPWIRPEAAGAQPERGIRPYDRGEGASVLDCAEGLVRMVTLAPEVPGADALLAELDGRGIVAALGHSLADASQIERGMTQGLRHVTHLFNAMGGAHHRDLGVAGFALTEDRLSCDLICDGVHVHPAFVRLAARAKGQRLLLITDRMELPESGTESFGSGAVHDDGQALRLADGTLAASRLTLDRAVANAVRFEALTLHEAVAACTLRPARLLGLEGERGTLRPGARADLVVLSAEGAVEQTWLAGERAV